MKESVTKWDCDDKIDKVIKSAKQSFNDNLEMLYIQALSNFLSKADDSKKSITEKMIEYFLKKRGYSLNYILKKPVMVKAFTCVYVAEKYIEIWHDIPNRSKQASSARDTSREAQWRRLPHRTIDYP